MYGVLEVAEEVKIGKRRVDVAELRALFWTDVVDKSFKLWNIIISSLARCCIPDTELDHGVRESAKGLENSYGFLLGEERI